MSTEVTRIFRFDASGCNGCDVEVLEATTLVALGELGIEIAERPDDANLLVVTGGSNLKSKRELEIAYNAMQAPRTVAIWSLPGWASLSTSKRCRPRQSVSSMCCGLICRRCA